MQPKNSHNATRTSGGLPPAAGIGLKPVHYDAVLEAADRDTPNRHHAPAWLEVHPQNYFGDGGPPHHWLSAIADIYPISFHSVGLSLGSADGLNEHDLEKSRPYVTAIIRPASPII